jgi:hypothetical protein
MSRISKSTSTLAVTPGYVNFLTYFLQIINVTLQGIQQFHNDWTNGQKIQAVLDALKAAAQALEIANPAWTPDIEAAKVG